MNQHTHINDSALGQAGALMVAASEIKQAGEASFLLVPQHFQHVDLTAAIEKANPAPYRKKGTVALTSIESFNVYVKDQARQQGTYIYADPDARTLTAVFNDHEYGERSTDAGWRDFRAVYNAELSREFATWLKNNKQPMEQEVFAVFLEDNIADVVEPSGETLLAIALTLQAKTEVNFNSSKRLDNGQVQLTYTENIDARAGAGAIEIPREFAIGCRLFKNGEGYKIRARLKYRLGGGNVKFWYELDRPENVIEDAFSAYVEKAKETGVKVLIGKP
ncbi:DUF2303 family protein [Noviherbaspirillum autotrophicum]|uniref:DUF2303 family protein n=1 Tax=Noviherbaspirillum autotrophicum TaxID=709839 RepID=UPI000693F9BF|nr:DUF2303 family protein [Noviherbaspirillum autotrophicum]